MKKEAEKINTILNELLEKNEVEIFGNLKIEVANMDDLALIKRNKIYLNVNTMKYPKYILKYIIAHELAHLMIKRHTKKFWEVVKRIYPQYEKGKNELLKILKNSY
jgi:predicted metal-dependent hydrolase